MTLKQRLSTSRINGIVVAAALAVVSICVYSASVADYVFPGESAHLMAVWSGLDVSKTAEYPLMAWFVSLLGVGNWLAPVFGMLAVVLMFLVTTVFLRRYIVLSERGGTFIESMLPGIVASVVFMLTPAVREAATHLEPRLFDFVWAMLIIAMLQPFGMIMDSLAWLVAIVAGVMAGFGLCDSPLFLVMLPLFVATLWTSARGMGKKKPWLSTSLLIFSFIVAFFSLALNVADDFTEFMRALSKASSAYITQDGWLFVAIFSTLPFVVSLFSSRRSLGGEGGLTQWIFHSAMTFVSILAISTPLSPSSQMAPYAVLPVATSAFAAFVAGYLVAYWWSQIKTPMKKMAKDGATVITNHARIVGISVGGIFSVVLLFTLILGIFDFDAQRGAFADRVAEKAIADLGERRWLVSDGSLDDHFRLAAARKGIKLNLVSLQRDLDESYLTRLAELVKSEGIGGDKNDDLSLSLSLGVLPFVQDWFSIDPNTKKEVAVWGAADLWFASGVRSVPEFLFFGADEDRVPDWEKDWAEFDKILFATTPEKGAKAWGSYRLARNKNPVERLRLDLRRHLGLVANNRGVWLQDKGRDDEAFNMYELVLNSIDADNICALFNEFELARSNKSSAAAKKRQSLEKKLKAIVDDADRRYRLWALGNYYGYIRSPEIFLRLGFNWARSGRPGEALQQIRRAIDFIPTDRRTSLMNMMAAIYASENDHAKSREVYEGVLNKDAENHDALIGMMRLEMMDGNTEKAIEYLERANAAAGDDPRSNIEKAMLLMMRNRLADAKALLRKATDANAADLQAWSFLAAVTIQQIDAEKDEKVRATLMKELEGEILATMEKQARDPSDYYVQTTRAFILLRKGEDKRREARDALIAASRDRPDIAATGDMILSLDISLNDTVDAERHAREVLRRNRRAPLANYVMGSLALQKGDYAEAEAYLRRSVDGPKPVVLALNDLAEVLRRFGKLDEAELYARRAVEVDPNLYVAWDTLATIIMAKNGDLDEAERYVNKACELSRTKDGREADVRMLISLARVQFAKGDKLRAKGTMRKVQSRISELSDFEKIEFEELRKSVK